MVERQACPHCAESIAAAAKVCRFCGRDPRRAPEEYEPPDEAYDEHDDRPEKEQPDATGGVIPYKNPPALTAYYLGVFSLLPCFPIGLLALLFGIKGLKLAREKPVVRGTVHAWIGIVMGVIFGFGWLALTLYVVLADRPFD